MYQAIMVALADGELDRAALTAGIQLARASAARLHIVHVRIRDPRKARDAEKDDFLEATTFAADELGESVSFELIEPAAGRYRAAIIASRLIAYAKTEEIDLIVMGTHARTRLERSILGSVGDELVRATTLPILLIPRRRHRAQNLRIRRVLIPLDGTPGSEEVLDDATQIATLAKSSVALLQVIAPEPSSTVTGDYQTMPLAHEEFVLRSARSEEYLDRIKERIESAGLEVEARTLVGDRVAPVIKSAAAVTHVDVIAIATRGLPPYALFRQTGIGDHLIDRARCALLIRRRQAADLEQQEPELAMT